jgi:hypothetical protein
MATNFNADGTVANAQPGTVFPASKPASKYPADPAYRVTGHDNVRYPANQPTVYSDQEMQTAIGRVAEQRAMHNLGWDEQPGGAVYPKTSEPVVKSDAEIAADKAASDKLASERADVSAADAAAAELKSRQRPVVA